jgi:hypothetical protein
MYAHTPRLGRSITTILVVTRVVRPGSTCCAGFRCRAEGRRPVQPREEHEATQRGEVLQKVEQLTVPLGGRVRPERMSQEGVPEDEQGQQTGDPSYLPPQHGGQAGDRLEGAEDDRPGGYGRAREEASADQQALETEADEHARSQHARG